MQASLNRASKLPQHKSDKKKKKKVVAQAEKANRKRLEQKKRGSDKREASAQEGLGLMSRDSQTAGSRGERLLPPRTSRFDRARTISSCECDTAMWSSWYTCLARRTRQRWLSSVQPLDGDGHAGSVLDHLVLHRPGDGFGLLLGFVQTEPVFHLLASLLALLQALLARPSPPPASPRTFCAESCACCSQSPSPERAQQRVGGHRAPTRGERGGVGTPGDGADALANLVIEHSLTASRLLWPSVL